MCPDPFNDIVDMIGIGVWVVFVIGMLKSWYSGNTGDLNMLSAGLVIWTSLIILCYFFAPRHSVCIGIPQVHPSRYDEWKEERANRTVPYVHPIATIPVTKPAESEVIVKEQKIKDLIKR
jgi:hypothetical protein